MGKFCFPPSTSLRVGGDKCCGTAVGHRATIGKCGLAPVFIVSRSSDDRTGTAGGGSPPVDPLGCFSVVCASSVVRDRRETNEKESVRRLWSGLRSDCGVLPYTVNIQRFLPVGAPRHLCAPVRASVWGLASESTSPFVNARVVRSGAYARVVILRWAGASYPEHREYGLPRTDGCECCTRASFYAGLPKGRCRISSGPLTRPAQS